MSANLPIGPLCRRSLQITFTLPPGPTVGYGLVWTLPAGSSFTRTGALHTVPPLVDFWSVMSVSAAAVGARWKATYRVPVGPPLLGSIASRGWLSGPVRTGRLVLVCVQVWPWLVDLATTMQCAWVAVKPPASVVMFGLTGQVVPSVMSRLR